METVGNATLGSQINHGIHHVARSCHTEAYVTGATDDHVGSLNEILWTLLHSDTSEERHHLVLARMVGTRNGVVFLRQRIDGIVNRIALTRILMILVDDRLARQLGDAHDTVGIVHTVLLNGIDGGVHLAARTIEVGGMHVNA